MNQIQMLAVVPMGHILRFDHTGGRVPRMGPMECVESYAVSFVERGRFRLLQHGQEICFQSGDVLLSYPGTIHRFVHPDECGDDSCLSVHFCSEVVKEVVEEEVSGVPRLKACGRTKFLLWQIREALRQGDQVAKESAMIEVLSAMLPEAEQWKILPCREPQFRFYAKRVAEAKALLDDGFDREHSLSSLARSVGMSAFHFQRIFHRLAGITPHQYLLRRRLRNSCRLLKQGASVTRAALDSGFNNQSHFTRMFRKHFSVCPKDYPKV